MQIQKINTCQNQKNNQQSFQMQWKNEKGVLNKAGRIIESIKKELPPEQQRILEKISKCNDGQTMDLEETAEEGYIKLLDSKEMIYIFCKKTKPPIEENTDKHRNFVEEFLEIIKNQKGFSKQMKKCFETMHAG